MLARACRAWSLNARSAYVRDGLVSLSSSSPRLRYHVVACSNGEDKSLALQGAPRLGGGMSVLLKRTGRHLQGAAGRGEFFRNGCAIEEGREISVCALGVKQDVTFVCVRVYEYVCMRVCACTEVLVWKHSMISDTSYIHAIFCSDEHTCIHTPLSQTLVGLLDFFRGLARTM